ncbi:MAG: NIF family HAD-type phosphatase [Leptospiraceae bacterium]|nr:NIF family HAD-type phosphatase [Leptospiraceae bacterium]
MRLNSLFFKKKKLVIIFDMDNTLSDEFGSSLRPGILELLTELESKNHVLKIWTSSTKIRALDILKSNKIYDFFEEFRFREDYDPKNLGLRKDIRKISGDALIDDDPEEIKFTNSIGLKGILVSPYRKNIPSKESDLIKIRNEINKLE